MALYLEQYFSIGIEFLQTFIGRFAQLGDVIMNTCGTLVGFLIGCLLLRITTRENKYQFAKLTKIQTVRKSIILRTVFENK